MLQNEYNSAILKKLIRLCERATAQRFPHPSFHFLQTKSRKGHSLRVPFWLAKKACANKSAQAFCFELFKVAAD